MTPGRTDPDAAACATGTAHRYLADPTPAAADRVGIALSGGGVRAACLGLGTLQVAEEQGLLGRVDCVSAVSGGSYIAASYLASRALMDDDAGREGTAGGTGGARPWSRGSDEEQHLKRNLHYLVESSQDLVLGVAHYAWGLLLNLVPLVAGVGLAGGTLGLLYDRTDLLAGVRTDAGDVIRSPHGWELLALAAALVLIAAWWDGRADPGSMDARFTGVIFGAAALAVLPEVVVLAVAVRGTHADAVAVVQQFGLTGAALAVGLVLVMRTQWAVAGGATRRVLRSLVRVLFAVSWIGGVALVIAYATASGVRADDGDGLAVIVASGAVLLGCGVVVHANTSSLHDKYARRLSRAYLVRAARERTNGTRLDRVPLRAMAGQGVPELIICAAVNLRERESALGEGCASFVFTPTIVGSPALRYLETQEFCSRLSSRSRIDERLHLSSLIAASGAAVAPNMGRYSRKGSRLALAVLNLRLGLWIVNPFLAEAASDESRPPVQSRRRSLWHWVRDGWYEPGPLATLQEAFGALSVRNRSLFISDGGHWDNSGIVELLRRRCSHIFAMDASNDPARLANILRAMSLARTELGVEFDADSSLLESGEPVRKIPFRYPEDTRSSPPRYVVLMRTFMSQDMPADIVALSRVNGAFPRHSTRDQFFSAPEAEAYVALGRWLCTRGIDIADLPPVPLIDLPEMEHRAGDAEADLTGWSAGSQTS